MPDFDMERERERYDRTDFVGSESFWPSHLRKPQYSDEGSDKEKAVNQTTPQDESADGQSTASVIAQMGLSENLKVGPRERAQE